MEKQQFHCGREKNYACYGSELLIRSALCGASGKRSPAATFVYGSGIHGLSVHDDLWLFASLQQELGSRLPIEHWIENSTFLSDAIAFSTALQANQEFLQPQRVCASPFYNPPAPLITHQVHP